MAQVDPLVEGFQGVLERLRLPCTRSDAARRMGVSLRRLRDLRRRQHLPLDEVQTWIEHWNRTGPQVKVELLGTGHLRVIGDGAHVRNSPLLADVQRNQLARGLAFVDQLWIDLERLLDESGGQRALLLRAGSEGSQLGEQPVGNVVAEVSRFGQPLASKVWADEPLEPHYLELLKEVQEAGSLHVDRLSLPVGMRLREIYTAQGIEHAFIAPVFTGTVSFWYISVTFKSTPSPGIDITGCATRLEPIARYLEATVVKRTRRLQVPGLGLHTR